jgi:uncharacterized protein DUF4406
MRIYIAGPMTGIPNFGFPAFRAAAAKLRAEGHEVFSPAEHTEREHGRVFSDNNASGDEASAAREYGFNRRKALADDLDWICRHADAVALLPGWGASKGANAEHATAIALGLEVIQL